MKTLEYAQSKTETRQSVGDEKIDLGTKTHLQYYNTTDGNVEGTREGQMKN